MTSLVWGAALVSSFAWAGFDVVRKRLATTIPVAELSLWLSLAQLPGYVVWALVTGGFEFGPDYLGPALGSIALNLASNLAILEAMRIAPISIAIPMLAFVPVFAAAFGVPLLGETLGARGWLGMSLVIVGAFFLSASDARDTRVWTLLRSFFGQRGVRLMLWVSLFWALTPICDKLALRQASVGAHGAVLSTGVAAGMYAYLVVRGRGLSLRVSGEEGAWLGLGGAVNVLALGLQFVAITSMDVGYFEALKRVLGLFLALGIGRVFFGETLTRRKLESATVMAVGALLVLL